MTINTEMRPVIRAARLYHYGGLDQNAIASRMGISQATVSRLLKTASAKGIAQVRIVTPDDCFPELEEKLIDAYALKDAIVIQEENFRDKSYSMVLGEYLQFLMRSGDVLATSSHYVSIQALAEEVKPMVKPLRSLKILQIIPDNGTLEDNILLQQTLGRLSEVWQAKLISFNEIIRNSAGKNNGSEFLTTRRIKSQDDMLSKITLAVVEVENLEFPLWKNRITNDQSIHAVGQLIGHPYDTRGKALQKDFVDDHQRPDLDLLRKIPVVLGIGKTGNTTVDALRAALKSGLVNILMTDTEMAAKLIG